MKAEGKIWVFFDSESQQETKPLSLVQAQMVLLQFKQRDIAKIFIWTPGWDDWQNLRSFLKSDQEYFVFAHPPKPNPADGKVPSPPTKPQSSDSPKTAKKSSPDRLFTKIDVEEQPKPATKHDYGYWHNDFNGDELDISKIRKISPLLKEENTVTASGITSDDRRRSQRHNLKIEIVLINKEGSFRTYSKNISLTGTLLEDEIPASYLKSSFDLVIINRFEKDPKKGRLLFKGRLVGDLSNPRRLMFIDTDKQMAQRLESLLKAYIQYQQLLKKSG